LLKLFSKDDNNSDMDMSFGHDDMDTGYGHDDMGPMFADEEDEEDEEEYAGHEEDEEGEEGEDFDVEVEEDIEEEEDDDLDLAYGDDKVTYHDDGSVTGGAKAMSELMRSMSREERDALRVKLAQNGVTFDDILNKAHPGGGVTTDLDVKPEGDLAKVETLTESKQKHMDVAQAAPRNVREAAENIQSLVKAGEIDPSKDFPALIAEGLDPQAVSYWKKFYGEAGPEGSKFVTEMVKGYNAKKAAEQEQNQYVKVARAFELAHAMAEKGLISREASSLRRQVDRIMKYDDVSFEDFSRSIKSLPTKQASVSDVASVNGVHDHVATAGFAPPSASDVTDTLTDMFSQAFSGRRY